MNYKTQLKIAPVGRAAGLYAVTHWHYSKTLPCGRLYILGVWEDDVYIGAVIFGYGGAPQINMPFGVAKHEICELVRVALRKHKSPVSRILGIALKILRKTMPNMILVVSYADSEHGHHGGIYQATNWVYVGNIVKALYVINGERVHSRNVEQKYKGHVPLLPYLRRFVDPNALKLMTPPKHKYVFSMTKDVRMLDKLDRMRKDYPKRATSIGADAAAFQAEEGGSRPTVALQSSRQMVGSYDAI